MLMQDEQKESYLKEVQVPLKRFSDYLKDKKWAAGDTVGLTVVTDKSCAVTCTFHCHFLLTSYVCNFHAQLTYVDFSLYEILDHHRLFEPALLEGCPVLKVSLSLVLSVSSGVFNLLPLLPCRNIWTALRQVQGEEKLLLLFVC